MRGIGYAIRKVTFPLPEDQETQGFKPNWYIRSLRRISWLLTVLLRLNGVNRFSNEFIQTLDPRMEAKLPNGKKLVFRTGHGRLLWRAKTFLEEEPMLISWIDGFAPDDYFYDVGANVGCYSLYAAQRGIRTIAFEPELNNAQLLYENTFLNGLQQKCMPVPIALGATTGVDVFYLKSVSKGDALHSVARKSYLVGDPDSLTDELDVLVMKLDDVVRLYGLPQPTRLKVDVDYNELQVIQGAQDTLKGVKEVYVEIDPKLDEHLELVKFLENNGFTIDNQLETPRRWNREISNYLFVKN